MNIQHKSTLDAPGTGVIATDEEHGIVEALVSVTGIRDNVNDIIIPGAYAKTLVERKPKGVWSHDWNTPVSKAIDAVELMPGDPRLPSHLPAEAGGLLVKAQFNLNTQAGREAWENVKFFGEDGEWSIGYTVPKGQSTEEKSAESPSGKVRKIKQINLFEFSPVLFGAASNARTFASSIKSMLGTDEAREEFIKALEEDATENELANEANAEGNVVENTEVDVAGEEKCAEEEDVDFASGDEGVEEVKNTRVHSVQLKVTGEVYEQLLVLQGELKKLIDMAEPEIKAAHDAVEPKALNEAIDDLVASGVDAKTVEEIVKKAEAFENAVNGGESSTSLADEVLDLVAAAFADVTAPADEKSLKVVAASVGLALKTAETADIVEVKEDEPVEETKTVTMSAADWAKFLADLDN
jgi:HK97 family phage prohead protease